jgi:DNA-binding response OmpR family regulator
VNANSESGSGGTIALVDDEDGLRETVALALRREGYRVEGYVDGKQAWDAFSRELPDLVILDILMPRMDGLELCRRLRARSEGLPILFLTSKDDEIDRVLGLELGGDDYLCKPFSMRELVARVKVLFRRLALIRNGITTGAEGRLETGRIGLDLDRFEATLDDRQLALTVTEFRILHALVRRPGHVKTRVQLMQEAYPDDLFVGERTVDSHIKRLRRKLNRIDESFDGIDTVYGLGYRLREM